MAAPTIDRLDRYLADRDYRSAIVAIEGELRKRPDSFNLHRQRAELLILAGRTGDAVDAYRRVVELCLRQGFTPRAEAVIEKLRRLAPGRTDVIDRLEKSVAEQREAAKQARARSRPAPPRSSSAGALATLFKAFEPETIEAVVGRGLARAYAAGETVFREGDRGDSLFLVVSGIVEARTTSPEGSEVLLARLGAGDLFGEISVLSGRPRTATIKATEPCRLVEVHRDAIHLLEVEHPRLRSVLEHFQHLHAKITVDAILASRRAE